MLALAVKRQGQITHTNQAWFRAFTVGCMLHPVGPKHGTLRESQSGSALHASSDASRFIMINRLFQIAAFNSAAFVWGAPQAQAATYFVSPCGDDSGGGLGPMCSFPFCQQCTAKRTIQAAVDAAANGDTIIVFPGVYNENVRIVGKSILLHGLDPAATVIDGTGFGFATLWAVDPSAPTIIGFTLTGGDSLAGGGVRIVENCTPTFIDCVFANNHSISSGAGAEIWDSDPTFIDCTFESNVIDEGGGIVYARYSSPEFIRCVFTNNTVGYSGGGAIHVGDGRPLYASRCRFEGNQVAGTGGAVSATGPALLDNCLFANNSAGAMGGAVVLQSADGQSVVTNCTFHGNSAAQGGGAIKLYGDGTLTIVKSILWNNGPDPIDPNNALVSVMYSDVEGGWQGLGNISAKPMMQDPANKVYWLAPGSPCIDAGDNDAVTATMTVDVGGNARRVEDPNVPDTGHGTQPIVDMGAYEFQPGQ
jgi:predicted outer membrane repeat protein